MRVIVSAINRVNRSKWVPKVPGLETVEGRPGGGPADAINRIHCFPPGNQLEQWPRHVIRAIKPHQITTPRHRVSLVRASAVARARSAQSTKAYINVMRPWPGVPHQSQPLPSFPAPFRRRRRRSSRSSFSRRTYVYILHRHPWTPHRPIRGNPVT